MDIYNQLLCSPEPIFAFKAAALKQDTTPERLTELQQDIKKSSIITKILSERNEKGEMPVHPYKKWYGAHWALYLLADLDYPAGDKSLLPLLEQDYAWLLSEDHRKKHLKVINGLTRRCASQDAVAIYAALKLGLADERTDELVKRLVEWQWPDGGWNCDKNPDAKNSSFMESLLPLRALSLYAKVKNDSSIATVAKHAADIFLKRNLYKRQSDGSIINEHFVRLHYPCYWHYDILAGLQVMAEAGFIHDPRCADALALLKSKQLSDGGFPAEEKYFQLRHHEITAYSLVDWGNGKKKSNPFVTLDALYVLKKAQES